MFQCEWLKRPTPLCHPLKCPLPFYPSPPPCWASHHIVFGSDSMVLSLILAFHLLLSPTFQRQISRVWRGRVENILLTGGEEEWRVCSKRETSARWGTWFEMVWSKTWGWDIVRKWPRIKLGPGPECHKWLLWQEAGVLSWKRVLSWLPFPFSVLFHVLGYSSFLQWDSPWIFCAHPYRNRGAAQRQGSIVNLSKSIHRQSILSLNKWSISSPVYLPGLQQPRLLIGSSLFPQQNNSFSFMDCSPQIQSWQKWKSIFSPLGLFVWKKTLSCCWNESNIESVF